MSTAGVLNALAAYGLPYGLRGSERGYSTAGDVLVNQFADGVSINAKWDEFNSTLDILNGHRTGFGNLLQYNTTTPVELEVPTGNGAEFEPASEFGEAKSARAPSGYRQRGANFLDYDIATRYTWKFLRDATSEQVEAVHQNILDGDNRLVNNTILAQAFNNTTGHTEHGYPVYGPYNGDDEVPEPYMGERFERRHNHFVTTGGNPFDQSDFDFLLRLVIEHGFGRDITSQIVAMLNPREGALAHRFSTDVASADGTYGDYDYVPAANHSPYYLPEGKRREGQPVSGQYHGLTVPGSYGPALVIESGFIPAGYVLVAATGGPGSPVNPIMFREHSNAAYRGLRLIPGNNGRYPLVDSFYTRGFGVGVRRRGALAALKVTTSADETYQPPVYRDGALVAP